MSEIDFQMPFEWEPRHYQGPALGALDRGCKRLLLLWHRRSGKDAMTLNWCAKTMADKPTSVLYLFPELGQGMRALFNELNGAGKTHIQQAFPEPLLARKVDGQKGIVRLRNGSILQVGGFDSIDRYMGSSPTVVVMSEFAVSHHAVRAWQLLQPILANNNGVAIFPYTPRGKTWGYDLFQMAQKNKDWFCRRLSIEDTKIITPNGRALVDIVQSDIESGEIDENYARQEYYCSWEAPNSGSYYGRLIEQAEQQGRVTDVPWDPSLPVYTWWDIGINDSTAIWFVQAHRGGEIRMIDFYESDGEGLGHYLDVLNQRRSLGWMFEPRGQLVPHDFGSREFSSGETREQAARKLGWRMTVVPRPSSVEDGIDAVRRILPRIWFDKTRCDRGLLHLKSYTKRLSKQLQMFTGPLHDVHSNAADAVRTGVEGMRLAGMHIAKNLSIAQREGQMAMTGNTRPVVAVTDFSVWGQ